MSATWEPVIGLEIHAQLQTQSKIFSSASSKFGAGDNENIDPVSLGLPGALPVINATAIEYAVKIGLALNCEIHRQSIFERKNYFYPDLPRGYQISQFAAPICGKGHLTFLVDGQPVQVGITRAHLEEDAGKSTHHGDYSLINLNRAGVPLLEIVSEPEIKSSREAAEYARTVRQILRFLSVCDGNLEEGSLRCDCNVSVRPKGQKKLGTKVELKNINSFRFVEKALDYEIQRQIDTLEAGESLTQETRLYDSAKNKTVSMRSKEEAMDYRYFPDPDLLPITFDQDFIEKIRQSLPELPQVRRARFCNEYELSLEDAHALTQEKDFADFFEQTATLSKNAKASASWIMSELLRELNENHLGIAQSRVSAEQLSELIEVIECGVISRKIGKEIFKELWEKGGRAKEIIEKKGLKQITDMSALEAIVDAVVSRSPDQVEQFRAGKTKVLGYFVGQVMKETQGQASPDMVNQILNKKLKG